MLRGSTDSRTAGSPLGLRKVVGIRQIVKEIFNSYLPIAICHWRMEIVGQNRAKMHSKVLRSFTPVQIAKSR